MAPRSASSERRTSSVCATQLSACLIRATLVYVTAALRSKATPVAARPAFKRVGIAARTRPPKRLRLPPARSPEPPRFIYLSASYSRGPDRLSRGNLTPPPRRFAPPLL